MINPIIAFVKDGFANIMKGIGTSKDPRTSTIYEMGLRITQVTANNLYVYNWLAAKVVDIPIDDATRKWRNLFIPDADKKKEIEEALKKFDVKGKVDKESKLFGKVRIDKGAEIRKSVIRGPVIIGENSRIVNSYIGPFTSVYFKVTIENSEIEHSIILENSKIRDIRRIEDSLVGQNVRILKSKAKPSAYRIMVGDSSRVEVV